MAYVESNAINMFPSSTRTSDIYSRFTTELNLVNMVNSVTDKDSYVVKWDSANKIIEFVLGGYYFKADVDSIASTLRFSTQGGITNSVWANCVVGRASSEEIDLDNRLLNWSNGQYTTDNNNAFQGISFTKGNHENPPTLNGYTTTFYYLQLFEVVNGELKVPSESMIKFESTSFNITEITNAVTSIPNSEIESLWNSIT